MSLSSYVHVPLNSLKDYAIYVVHFILLQITLFGFTYVLTLNKWLFKIVFSILFICFGLVSFWVYTMDVTVSVDLISLSLESKPDVFLDLISWPFLIYSIGLIIVLYSILYMYSKLCLVDVKLTKSAIFAILAVIFFFLFEEIKPGVFSRRMPYIVVYESKKCFEKQRLQFGEIKDSLYAKNKINIVFILGESVRSKNLQLNGYYKETTPFLSHRKDIYSFKNVFTTNTYTAKCVPQILTSKGVLDTLNNKVFSLYSVLNKVNYNTVWIGNQTPEISYRNLILQNKKVELIDVEHSVLSYHKKHDEELLNVFKECYNTEKSNFYTLHMIGSHWWYENRYPERFKFFSPVVKTKFLPSSTSEEIINSYDNTIRYLDYFLNETISFLEKKNNETLLIYLSDHGETLGENGKWLHAQGNEASKNPACIIWGSKLFKENHQDLVRNLQSKLDKKITTDFLYHSIIDIIDVKGFKYQKRESVFSNNP